MPDLHVPDGAGDTGPDLDPLTLVLSELPRFGLVPAVRLAGRAARLDCPTCTASLTLRTDGALALWQAVRRLDAFAHRHRTRGPHQ